MVLSGKAVQVLSTLEAFGKDSGASKDDAVEASKSLISFNFYG